MFADTALHRPQKLLLRRALFQIHLWVGIGVGLYIFVVGLTGAILVFREDIEGRLYPQLFKVNEKGGTRIEMADLLDRVRTAYPQHQLLGVYAPSGYRETYVAWLSKDQVVTPLFVHPATGAVLGTRPDGSWVRWFQDLHFYLLGGKTGLKVNGIGAVFLIVLCITGLFIWWPGIEKWRRGLTIDFANGWKRINWDLHSAVGFWTVAFVMIFAATGAYFAFPQQFRSIVNIVSSVTAPRAPSSNPQMKNQQPAAEFRSMIAVAQEAAPGAELARVSLPTVETGAFQVVMAPNGLREANEVGYVSFYFDQYSGALLQKRPHVNNTAGDVVMAWVGALHVGNFGGLPVKILWAILGLAPSLLFVTGALMWWNRVLSERWNRNDLETSSARRFPARSYRA